MDLFTILSFLDPHNGKQAYKTNGFSSIVTPQEGPSGTACQTVPVHWSPAVLTFWPQNEQLTDRLWLVKGKGKVLYIIRASV